MSTLAIKKQVSAETSAINDHAEGHIAIGAGVREKEVATLTLYDNGMIRTCNQAGGELLGCSTSEVTGQHITRLLPQLVETKLVQDKKANAYLRFLSRIGHHFEVVNMRGTSFASELFFNDMKYLGQHYLRVIICPVR